MKFWNWIKAFFSPGQTKFATAYNRDRLQVLHKELTDHRALPHDAIEINKIQENLMDHIADFEEDTRKISELDSRLFKLEDKLSNLIND